MSESKRRARYTLEYKLEAVRLVKGGQVSAATAKILGIPKQTLENWATSRKILLPTGCACTSIRNWSNKLSTK